MHYLQDNFKGEKYKTNNLRRSSQYNDLPFPKHGSKGKGQMMGASHNEIKIEKERSKYLRASWVENQCKFNNFVAGWTLMEDDE